MSGDTVVRYKVHFVWQDDREERWLRDMARQGLHLVTASPFCRYVFRRGAPADIAYRLDYVRNARRDPGYYQLFQDAGWDHVLSCMGWQYWRKSADGTEPEIFTDGASKADRLRRVRNSLVAVAVPSLSVICFNPAYWQAAGRLSSGTHLGVAAITVTLAAIYVYIFSKLNQRIRAISSPA
ncbi:MAG: DUF2812 domain-containing protein [Telluria sp.]